MAPSEKGLLYQFLNFDFFILTELVLFSRGGGELGREWYLQGKLKNKHKGFEVRLYVALLKCHVS